MLAVYVGMSRTVSGLEGPSWESGGLYQALVPTRLFSNIRWDGLDWGIVWVGVT